MEEAKKSGRLRRLLDLYIVFMRIGGLTFGGGLAMLPMLEYELVRKKQWLEEEELLDCYAIGQCTPGIIAVNTATFVGYKKEKILGGIFSTLGMVTPSLVIITIVSMFLREFMDNVWLQHALMGIRGVVCALMLNTVFNLAKKSLLNLNAWILAVVVFALAYFMRVPTVILVIMAAIEGINLDRMNRKAEEKAQKASNKEIDPAIEKNADRKATSMMEEGGEENEN